MREKERPEWEHPEEHSSSAQPGSRPNEYVWRANTSSDQPPVPPVQEAPSRRSMRVQFIDWEKDAFHVSDNNFTYVQGLGFIPDSPMVYEQKAIRRTAGYAGLAMLFYLALSWLLRLPVGWLLSMLGFDFTVTSDGVVHGSAAMQQIFGMIVYILELGIPTAFLYFALQAPHNMRRMLKAPRKSLLFMSLPMAISVSILSGLCLNIIMNLLSFAGFRAALPETAVPKDHTAFILYLIAMTILPAVLEEFFFRGVLMTAFRRFGDTAALFISALLFALAHANLLQSISAFVMGLVLGYFVMRSGSIWTGVLIHFANNLLSVLVPFVTQYLPGRYQTVALLGFYVLIMIIGILCCVLFARRDNGAFTLMNPKSRLTIPNKVGTAMTSVSVAFFAVLILIQYMMLLFI